MPLMISVSAELEAIALAQPNVRNLTSAILPFSSSLNVSFSASPQAALPTCGFCCIMALVIFMEKNLPKRRHPRLDHYDYSAAGAYFITICTQDRRCLLSRVVGRGLAPAEIQYTAYGQIAKEQLLLLEQTFLLCCQINLQFVKTLS